MFCSSVHLIGLDFKILSFESLNKVQILIFGKVQTLVWIQNPLKSI
jgi:hypothetical protein